MKMQSIFLLAFLLISGLAGTARSDEKATQVLSNHRDLIINIERARIQYRINLNEVRQSNKRDAYIKVLEKKRISDLLLKIPPPVSPSVVFFSSPWPDGYPGPPDPRGWIPKIDRDWLLQVERLRKRQHHFQLCASTQSLSVDSSSYIEINDEGVASCSQSGSKSLTARASAGQSTTGNPPISIALGGFRSKIVVPTADKPTIDIISSLNSSFTWIEANTHGTADIGVGASAASGGGGYAKVSAKTYLNVFAEGEIISPNPENIVEGEVSGQDQLYYPSISGVGTELSVTLNLPSGGPYEIIVEELLELTAAASSGHAFISGGFTWDPLAVTIREDCHTFSGQSGPYLPY